MSIALSTYYAGQTNYIAAMNSDNGIIQTYLNLHDADIATLKGAVGVGADLDFRLTAFNLLLNGGLDYWQRGTATRPDCWTIENAGVGFAIARESTEKYLNTYSAMLTNSGSLTQELDDTIRLGMETTFSVTLGVWIKTSTASSARIGVWNGTVWQYSNYHAGDGVWAMSTVTFTHNGTTPSEIKFGLFNTSGTAYFNAMTAIKGNPAAGVLFIANDPTVEELRVFGHIESGQTSVKGVGMRVVADRELTTNIRFIAPKRSAPTIVLEDEDTGYEITYGNVTRFGFDLTVTEINGASGTNGFEYENITWRAEV
jgi:hypothetical protein